MAVPALYDSARNTMSVSSGTEPNQAGSPPPDLFPGDLVTR